MSKINLQMALFLFVNKVSGNTYSTPSAIFIQFSKAEESVSSVHNSTLEKLTLTKEFIAEQEENVISNRRLFIAIDNFCLMMVVYPITIFCQNGSDGSFSSKELFLLPESKAQLLQNEFLSLNEAELLVESFDYEQSYKKYCNIYDASEELSKERRDLIESIRRVPRASCNFDLFNRDGKGIHNFLTQYPNDKSYQDDGELSLLFQNEYALSATDANRNIVSMLKMIKSSLP